MGVWVENTGGPVTPQRVAKAEVDPGMAVVDNAPVVAALRRLLADAVSFYLRAHGFHWNVKGPDFSEYHALFEAIYSDVYESVDPIAENIVKLDGIAPFRLPELMALRSLSDAAVNSPLPATMAADLLAGNEVVLASIDAAFQAATVANQQGIANFLAERNDQHMKWAWQLKASVTGA